jgi:hypothetical protein
VKAQRENVAGAIERGREAYQQARTSSTPPIRPGEPL